MFVVARRQGERLLVSIGDEDIEILVTNITGKIVRLSFRASAAVEITRLPGLEDSEASPVGRSGDYRGKQSQSRQ